ELQTGNNAAARAGEPSIGLCFNGTLGCMEIDERVRRQVSRRVHTTAAVVRDDVPARRREIDSEPRAVNVSGLDPAHRRHLHRTFFVRGAELECQESLWTRVLVDPNAPK